MYHNNKLNQSRTRDDKLTFHRLHVSIEILRWNQHINLFLHPFQQTKDAQKKYISINCESSDRERERAGTKRNQNCKRKMRETKLNPARKTRLVTSKNKKKNKTKPKPHQPKQKQGKKQNSTHLWRSCYHCHCCALMVEIAHKRKFANLSTGA